MTDLSAKVRNQTPEEPNASDNQPVMAGVLYFISTHKVKSLDFSFAQTGNPY